MPNSTEDISLITRILKQLELFQNLNQQDHAEIIKRITLEYFPKDHVIFNKGDAGDSFYIIKRGMVRVFHPEATPDEEKEVAIFSDGDFFGEMALIGDKPRNASTQTVEESEIFKLRKDDFIRLVSSDPNMAGRISDEFIRRLKINMKQLD